MIIHSIQARDFMRFGDFTLEGLPARGIIGIFGDNECGKSTVGELICFCLFGRTTRAAAGESEQLIRWGAESCEASMRFSVGREIYFILRLINADGTCSGYMKNLTDNKKITENPARIEQEVELLLGYGFREFRYSTFIAQNELDIILHSAGERKKVLNNMLGVGCMEKAASRTAEKRRSQDKIIANLATRIADKSEVLAIYRAREEDIRALDEELDGHNRALLAALRERDQHVSTISLLEEIKRKREQYDVLDMRISNRRDRLKKIENEAAELMRRTEKIPKLLEENTQKESEIETIRGERLAALEDKLRRVDEYRNLIRRREEQIKVVELKEAALSRLTEKLEDFAKKEDMLRRATAEQTAIDYFIESFSGENRYRTMASHLVKDVELLEKELSRVRASLAAEANDALGEEKKLAARIEKIQGQLQTEPIREADPALMEVARAKEKRAAKGRNAAFGAGAISTFAGCALAVALSNPLLLLICIPVLPAALAASAANKSLSAAREEQNALQQQFYAYTVAQRGLLESEDSLEEVQNLHGQAVEALKGSGDLLEAAGAVSVKTFGELEAAAAALKDPRLKPFERARGVIEEILSGYQNLHNLVGDDTPLADTVTLDPGSLLLDSKNKMSKLETLIKQLEVHLAEKPKFVEQSESYVKEIQHERGLLAELDRAITGLGVTAADEPNIRAEIQDADEEIEAIRTGIAANEKEVADIRTAAEQAGALEKKRKQIVSEIDGDLIQFYELREATRDIDCTDQRFADIRRQLETAESKVAENRKVVTSLDAKRAAIRKDLERSIDVEKELSRLNGERQDLEARQLKYRELETLFISAGLDIKKRLIPQIESYFSWILPRMTRGRYHQVRLSDDFEISVYSEEKGGYVSLDTLSGGTMDQLLISLRLAFARAATSSPDHPHQFLFLDEPISSFDEARRELFFSLLETLKAGFQQIFLISHIPNLEEFTDCYLHVTLADSAQPAACSWK